MKSLVSIGVLSVLFLTSACSEKNAVSTVNGDDFVGSWTNPNSQKSQSSQDVVINDRIIIEKSDAPNTYATTILSKGIFTPMKFNPENGLLCAENKACFQLKEGKLRLGSKEGVLTYDRENTQ